MRVLVVSESFLPQINGVTNSVRRVLEHLAAEGHDAELIAPTGPDIYAGFRVRRARGANLPFYKDFRLGLETRRRLRAAMLRFRPDVVTSPRPRPSVTRRPRRPVSSGSRRSRSTRPTWSGSPSGATSPAWRGGVSRFELVVVGAGPEEQRLRGLLPEAHFLDLLHGQDLSRAYASLDVFVHTGRHETFCQSAPGGARVRRTRRRTGAGRSDRRGLRRGDRSAVPTG